MSKIEGNKKSVLQPMPKVVVSCRDKDGNDNALVVGYCGNCSYDPPMVMVGIVPSRHSHKMVKESGCFIINIATTAQQDIYDCMGSISGKDVDKFKKIDLKTEQGQKVNAPILTDCPINIECTVVDSIVTGSHEMFIGKIEYVHAEKDLLDENGNVNYSSLKLI